MSLLWNRICFLWSVNQCLLGAHLFSHLGTGRSFWLDHVLCFDLEIVHNLVSSYYEKLGLLRYKWWLFNLWNLSFWRKKFGTKYGTFAKYWAWVLCFHMIYMREWTKNLRASECIKTKSKYFFLMKIKWQMKPKRTSKEKWSWMPK